MPLPTVRALPLSCTLAPLTTTVPASPKRAKRLAGAEQNVAPLATLTAVWVPRAVELLELSVPPVTFTISLAFMAIAAALSVKAPESLLVMVRAAPPSFSAPRISVPTPLPLLATSKVGLPVSKTPPLLPKVRL